MERSSAVPSREAQELLVVRVRSVGGGAKKLGRVVGVAYVGGEGRGCCPRARVIAREAVKGVVFAKGADDVTEIPSMLRLREGLR